MVEAARLPSLPAELSKGISEMTTTTYTPTGDYLLDWDLTGADGTASLASGSGGANIGVSVSTPKNGQDDQWCLVNGELKSNDVEQQTKAIVEFDTAVDNLNFQLKDVDEGSNWDDKVTVQAYNSNGDLVDVTFSGLQNGQVVNGNTIEGEGALCDEGVTVTISEPIVKLVIIHDNGADASESGHVMITDMGFDAAGPGPDGAVDGEDFSETMVLGYDDSNAPTDGGGDKITTGDDLIYGNGGDDYIEGDAGDDVIYGDTGGAGTARESFEWDLLTEAEVDTTATQDTGQVTVTYTVLKDTGDHESALGTADLNVDGIDTGGEAIDTDSSLKSSARGEDNEGDFQWEFSEPVENVEFNVNDIDGDGVVRITAYDAAGNPVAVELSGGAELTLLDTDSVSGADTADSNGGYDEPDTDDYNLQVTIPGPVSRIVLEHDQDGGANSGIFVTDMYYDVTVPDTGVDGNDTLIGGLGDDEIYGEGGDDIIDGGDGSDTVFGGDGDDTIDTSGSVPLSDYGADLPDPFPDILEDPIKDNDIDFVDGGAGNDTITTGDDADTILGGTGEDNIDGGLDDDTIDGGEGNDFIIGGHGSDTIEGGTGDDTIYGGLGAGTDPLNIQDEDDPFYGVDDPRPDNGMDVINGGDGNDTIYGQDDDDTIDGGAGDDFIDGGIDDDTIEGGTGNDTIIGGQGADTMSGGDGRDTFIGGNDGDVVDGGTGGDDYDVLDLSGDTPINIINETVDADGDSTSGTVQFLDGGGNVTGTMDFFEIEKIIPCFTPGTMIATPKGEVPVETLKSGDRVITRDNGIQEIAWVGRKDIGFKEIAANPHLRPVLIRAGSLGNGLPERDMMVSPNHRILVANDRTALYFDEREVLAAAKHMVDNKGIMSVEPMGVSYLHFMFEHHEVVLSDGAWTESFQPGDYSLKGVGNAQRQEIYELFPELESREGIEDYAAARRILKKHEAQMLVKG